jgi:hypothetical protein
MAVVIPLATARGPVTVIHDAGPPTIDACRISPGLCAILRSPVVRRPFLRALAADPQVRLTLAVAEGVMVGRATVAPAFGRWRRLSQVREFGIEVARDWRRGAGLGLPLARLALADPAVADELLLGFGLPSAWDLAYERTPLAVYRRRLVALAARLGFQVTETDEPEIAEEPGAVLVVRVGARVGAAARAAFTRARYRPGGGHRARA